MDEEMNDTNGGVRGTPELAERNDAHHNDAVVAESQMPKTRKPRPYSPKLTEHVDTIVAGLDAGQTLGEISKTLGVSRTSLDNYVHSREDLLECLNDSRERKLDLMENVVLSVATIDSTSEMTENGSFARNDGRVMTANLNAAKFYLERMGAKRGWGAKLETNEIGNGGGIRVPMIFMGDVSEEMIANAEAQIREANRDAGV